MDPLWTTTTTRSCADCCILRNSFCRWCTGRRYKILVVHWIICISLRCVWKVQGRWESLVDARTNHKVSWRKIQCWPFLSEMTLLAEQKLFGIEPNEIVEVKTWMETGAKDALSIPYQSTCWKGIRQNSEAGRIGGYKIVKTVVCTTPPSRRPKQTWKSEASAQGSL